MLIFITFYKTRKLVKELIEGGEDSDKINKSNVVS